MPCATSKIFRFVTAPVHKPQSATRSTQHNHITIATRRATTRPWFDLQMLVHAFALHMFVNAFAFHTIILKSNHLFPLPYDARRKRLEAHSLLKNSGIVSASRVALNNHCAQNTSHCATRRHNQEKHITTPVSGYIRFFQIRHALFTLMVLRPANRAKIDIYKKVNGDANYNLLRRTLVARKRRTIHVCQLGKHATITFTRLAQSRQKTQTATRRFLKHTAWPFGGHLKQICTTCCKRGCFARHAFVNAQLAWRCSRTDSAAGAITCTPTHFSRMERRKRAKTLMPTRI